MTTDRQMAKAYAAQEEVIVALRSIGGLDLAERLEDCTTTRLLRHSGSGWPHICRSAACAWCRRPMIRGWWYGMCQWSASATTSLAIIPLHLSAGLPNAVRRLRRGLRDVRDRMARRRRLWRDVSLAGIAGGDHMALVMITHEGIDRR
jgi:heme exporter protein D